MIVFPSIVAVKGQTKKTMETPQGCLEANDQLNRPSHAQVVWVSATGFSPSEVVPSWKDCVLWGAKFPWKDFLLSPFGEGWCSWDVVDRGP